MYPVMTEEQFAIKLFPMYRYFVTVWLRSHNPEVRCLPPGNGSLDYGAERAETPLDPALFPGPHRGSDLINGRARRS